MTVGWGDDEPEPIPWANGPWSLEVRGDELASIRFDGSLVLRSVRAVVRDRDWATVPVTVVSSAFRDDGFTLGLRFAGLGAAIDATLIVDTSYGLSVAFAGTALAEFDRNRLGLVVLHPPAIAGHELIVVSPGGSETHSVFPVDIAPHQPALDIAGLRWRTDGVDVALDFAGDVFEMEDQRNWTDASYKTYSTPLALPFPVRLEAGDHVEQSIALRCERVAPARPAPAVEPITLAAAGWRVPAIALGASTAPEGMAPLEPPSASALLVELDTTTPNWRAALTRAASSALPLDVRIVVATPREVGLVLDDLRELDIVRLGVFSSRTHVTEPELWGSLVGGVAARGIRAALLGGARSHFTELNREHARLPDLTAVAFSVTPQMHATERAQLVESIAMQRLAAENAVRIAAGRPVHVGPVTLRSRFNAVATTPPPASTRTDLAEGYGAELVAGATDARQSAPALAAWTIASAAALAVHGVESITYFEQWGPRGVEGFPVQTAVQWLQELAGHELLAPSRLPDGIWLLGASVDGVRVILAANLTTATATLTLEGAPVILGAYTAARLAF